MPDWITGLDVSVHQGNIDWGAVARSGRVGYVFIKASEGYGFKDPKWDQNREGAKAANMLWGAYHFARPNGGPNFLADARSEAEWFVNVGGASGPLPGVLDLEDSQLGPEDTKRWAVEFCDTVNRLARRTMTVLYCGYYFLGGGVAEDDRLRHCPWWLAWYTAGYDVDPDPFRIGQPKPNRGRSWDLWQYTSSGRCPGIGGNVDLNVAPRSVIEHLLNSWVDKQQQPEPTEEEKVMKKTIVHVDTRTTPRLRAILNDPDGFENVAFVCYEDDTMKQILGEEIGKYKFYGATEILNDDGTPKFFNGEEAEANWWFQFSLRDRDFAGRFPMPPVTVGDVEIPAATITDEDKKDIARHVLAALKDELDD